MAAADPKELARLAELACERANKKGAQGAAAGLGFSRRFRVVLRDGKQEELTASVSRGLSLKLYVDGRYGSHRTSMLDEKSLATFVDDAVEMTRLLMPDKNRSLPDPKYYRDRSKADLHLYDAGIEQLTPQARKQRAMAAHEAARAAMGEKLISVGAGVGDSEGLYVLRTTNGFADQRHTSSFSQWASVSAKDPSGRRPSDWAEDGSRKLAGLIDSAQVGKEAAARTLAQIGAGHVASCTLPMIVENRAVGRLLGGLLSPLEGLLLDQKRSCFEASLGQQIAAPLLSITDDPFVVEGWSSRRFDGEGLTVRKRPIVKAGVLEGFYIDSYYAKKLGREPTGAGTNLVFALGPKDADALCKAAGKAILVTGFLGGNSNSTTGDFSHGINGFLIEGGKRSRPIASMNVAGNHKTFWKTLKEVGNDPYKTSSRLTPSLLFGALQIAGN